MKIITCQEWGARPPRSAAILVGPPNKGLVHHTFSHVRQLDSDGGESFKEACQFARDIQDYHMDTHGWNDTGQNFTVTRGGHVLEGRHESINSIKRGRMIVSAHCPGQNDQPGIELEHRTEPSMTPLQYESLVDLFVWIFQCCNIKGSQIYGHKDFYATACPAELYKQIPSLRHDVAEKLVNPYDSIPQEMFRWFLWKDRGSIPEERPLARVRERIPQTWWVRYKLHRGNQV